MDIERWVRELRSGKWKQCRGYLDDGEGGHCCLGVLAKLEGFPEVSESDYVKGEDIDGSSTKSLYYKFKTFEGFDFQELIDMNDDGYTFSQIADYISGVDDPRESGPE